MPESSISDDRTKMTSHSANVIRQTKMSLVVSFAHIALCYLGVSVALFATHRLLYRGASFTRAFTLYAIFHTCRLDMMVSSDFLFMTLRAVSTPPVWLYLGCAVICCLLTFVTYIEMDVVLKRDRLFVGVMNGAVVQIMAVLYLTDYDLFAGSMGRGYALMTGWILRSAIYKAIELIVVMLADT